MPQVLLSGSASHILGRALLRAWPKFCGKMNGETPLISLRFLLRIKHCSEYEKGFEWDNCGSSSDIFFSFLSPPCLQCWKQKKIKGGGVENLNRETWQVRGVFSYLPARCFWSADVNWQQVGSALGDEAGLGPAQSGWLPCFFTAFLHKCRQMRHFAGSLPVTGAELLPCYGRTAWGEMQ